MSAMRDSPWFYLDAIPPVGETATLSGDEARHVLGSRRLSAGDSIVVFDGRGTIARTTMIEAPSRRTVTVRVDEVSHEPQPSPPIHLATALPKGDRLSMMVNMAAQLGAASILPMTCARSVVRVRPNLWPRLERITLEACKQSRQPWRPTIAPETTPAELSGVCDGPILVAHPGGRPLRDAVLDSAVTTSGTESVTLVIGPEGGFTDDEVATLTDAGALTVDLGPSVLRLETAAVAVLAGARLLLHGASDTR